MSARSRLPDAEKARMRAVARRRMEYQVRLARTGYGAEGVR